MSEQCEAAPSYETRDKGKLLCAELEKVWDTINHFITEMVNKGVTPAHEVTVAIRGAKVLINLCKYHPHLAHNIGPESLDTVQGMCVSCCGADIVARIECELRNVADLVTLQAFNNFGGEYAMQWQKRIGESWKGVTELEKRV